MFGVFENLTKAAIGIITTPIAVAADIATMGGALTDKNKPYTVKKLEDIYKNIENASKPDNKKGEAH